MSRKPLSDEALLEAMAHVRIESRALGRSAPSIPYCARLIAKFEPGHSFLATWKRLERKYRNEIDSMKRRAFRAQRDGQFGRSLPLLFVPLLLEKRRRESRDAHMKRQINEIQDTLAPIAAFADLTPKLSTPEAVDAAKRALARELLEAAQRLDREATESEPEQN